MNSGLEKCARICIKEVGSKAKCTFLLLLLLFIIIIIIIIIIPFVKDPVE
jgi:hypothetical protein